MTIKSFFLIVICSCGVACTRASSSTPTAADARKFLENVNETTLKLDVYANRAGWVQQTFITDDTEALAARAYQAANDAGARFAKESTKYDKGPLGRDDRR